MPKEKLQSTPSKTSDPDEGGRKPDGKAPDNVQAFYEVIFDWVEEFHLTGKV